MKIDLYGKKRINTPNEIDIRLGTNAVLGNPSDSRFDHVRLPNENSSGPKYSS